MQTLEPLLAHHPFFNGLQPEYVQLVTGCTSNVRYPAGTYIFREGEEASNLYVIRQGKVALELGAAPGGPMSIETIEAGEPPLLSHMVKVDLRIVTLTVPPQEVITRDNVTVKVTAVLYFSVVDPIAAVVNVVNFQQASAQIGQTTLRNVLGQSVLDDLLAERNKINQKLQAIIDEHTSHWGVKVSAVEIKDVELPATMQGAMTKQAEAEREKRAKVIHAQGEWQASTKLAQAAQVLSSQPTALQLRYLQTLTEIAVEKNSTILFPLPIDLVKPLLEMMRDHTRVSAREPVKA